MKKLFSKSLAGLDDVHDLALEINKLLPKKSTILLTGDLGAGKTTFVAAFCKLHNISQVSSPTYAIHNRYQSEAASIDHLDLYRLDDEDSLESAGVHDILNRESDYKFIEWPERMPGIENISESVFKLSLKKTGETGRIAEFFKN
ncbi:MAG: putative ATPase/GTPase [Pseudobdellovibrio sp.]|jgi:tRNA threonylcarbamoyladenosine biosynthesis protein TsaE|nr:putative ATPase/GTPase [Pseudobdellovibrio sp.]